MIYSNKDFVYDSETGDLFHARDKAYGKIKKGSLCSKNTDNGYLNVKIGQKRYRQHRVAWFLAKGYWPKEMDHINGIRNDNRLCNLREVTRLEQGKNQKIFSTNTSKCCGVGWRKDIKKWRARIMVAGKCINLGNFADWHEAFNKRKTAEVEFGFHYNHGKR